MRHCVVATTGRDVKEQRRSPAHGAHEKQTAAVRLTPAGAATLWYCMGLAAPRLRPPRRYRYAYDLGRKTAALKGPAGMAALRPGRAG